MTLEMLAAKHGDCFILRCGTPAQPQLVLIDGGPAGVWNDSLKPRLMEIRGERGLDDHQALTIDLLIISHVDDDHINGVLGLLEFIHDRVQRGEPPLFRISRISITSSATTRPSS
jgi:glyoxylase-like metal-dependent hydrolase (beta-lactamase superfamily II)